MYEGNIMVFQIGFQQREIADINFEVFRAMIVT
jgi:hypothetical protein